MGWARFDTFDNIGGLRMKPAVSLDGKPHKTVDLIQYGVAAGWRRVFFNDGTDARMTCAEVASLGVDPFVNVNDLHWEV